MFAFNSLFPIQFAALKSQITRNGLRMINNANVNNTRNTPYAIALRMNSKTHSTSNTGQKGVRMTARGR